MNNGLLWDRTAILTLGAKGLAGSQSVGLRVAFEIEKTSTSESNAGKIKVWNLSPLTKSFITGKNAAAILEVGYGPDTEELFRGDVTKVVQNRQGPDIITELECGDGYGALRDARVDKSYVKGTPLKVIMLDTMAQLAKEGLSISKTALASLKNEVLQNGFTASGLAKTVMDQLTARMGTEWSVQDGEVVILSPQDTLMGTGVMITPESGLIGNPIRISGGIQFKALIQPNLGPGRLVQIQSRDIPISAFKIVKSMYSGDTHDNPWYVTCEAVEVLAA